MDTSTWERVELLRGWLDKQGTAASADDVRLLRVLKISEEVGEVAEALYGYVGEFQERLSLSSENAWIHGRVMSPSSGNTWVLASGPWLCTARRGGPGAAEVQDRSVRGDPP